MQIQKEKPSLASKLSQKFLGATISETREVANEINAVVKSGDDFLSRAIKLFNRKNDLEVAYENDSDALDGQGGGWGMLSGISVFGGMATLGLVAMTAPYGVGFVAALLASPVAIGVVAGCAAAAVACGIREYQVSKALGSIWGDVRGAHSEAESTLKSEIENMQLRLTEQTPDVREQFNRAYELSLKKTEIFEDKIAAENEAEALEELAAAKRAQASSTIAAGVIVASSMNR